MSCNKCCNLIDFWFWILTIRTRWVVVLFLLSWNGNRWTESLHFLETLFSSVKCWVPCLTENYSMTERNSPPLRNKTARFSCGFHAVFKKPLARNCNPMFYFSFLFWFGKEMYFRVESSRPLLNSQRYYIWVWVASGLKHWMPHIGIHLKC